MNETRRESDFRNIGDILEQIPVDFTHSLHA